jgi:hypothetical protein
MTQLIESVLRGGGEMGERMRAFDWSTTALGPLEQWPQSLRICAQIILGSAYPMGAKGDHQRGQLRQILERPHGRRIRG